jgi:hypothetical protein
VRPLITALFPKEGAHVDHHHTFMVQYKADQDLGLDMHTDASDVTLNVCLGRQFTGVTPHSAPNPLDSRGGAELVL